MQLRVWDWAGRKGVAAYWRETKGTPLAVGETPLHASKMDAGVAHWRELREWRRGKKPSFAGFRSSLAIKVPSWQELLSKTGNTTRHREKNIYSKNATMETRAWKPICIGQPASIRDKAKPWIQPFLSSITNNGKTTPHAHPASLNSNKFETKISKHSHSPVKIWLFSLSRSQSN